MRELMGLLDKGNTLKLYIHLHSPSTHEINKIVKATKKIARSNYITKGSSLMLKSLKHEHEEKKQNILSKRHGASDPAYICQPCSAHGARGSQENAYQYFLAQGDMA